MSIIDNILKGFGYEKVERAPLHSSFGDATRNFFTTLSDKWEEKVAGPARERRANNRSTSRSYSSGHDSGWTWPTFDFGGGGDGGGGGCGGGE